MNSMDTGQPRYANEDRAQGVATKTWNTQGVRLAVYLCLHCTGYHLTHQTRQQFKTGWREPKLSQRQLAAQRKAEKRRFKR